MTPSPSEAAAKVAQAAAGTQSSAKEYKRESNTARVLGAGAIAQSLIEFVANWRRMRGNCGAHDLPPRRYYCKAVDEQLWQGTY